MKYKIGNLIKDYIDNSIDRKHIELEIKSELLQGKKENLDRLNEELNLVEKKVKIIDDLFIVDTNTNKAPIEEILRDVEWKIVKGIYIDRIGKGPKDVGTKLGIEVKSHWYFKRYAFKKLNEIEVELN